jgi:hypothetical protein
LIGDGSHQDFIGAFSTVSSDFKSSNRLDKFGEFFIFLREVRHGSAKIEGKQTGWHVHAVPLKS